MECLRFVILACMILASFHANAGEIHPAIESIASSLSYEQDIHADLKSVINAPEKFTWQPYQELIPPNKNGDKFVRHVVKFRSDAKPVQLMFSLTEVPPEISEWTVIDTNGLIRAQGKMGSAVPLENWSEQQYVAGFRFNARPGETLTIYGKYKLKIIMLADFSIDEPAKTLKDNAKSMSIYWVFLGSTIAILVYNSAMYFTTGEVVYLVYVLFLASLLTMTTAQWGIFQFQFARMAPQWAGILYSTIFVSEAIALFMIMVYLGKDSTSQRSRTFAKILISLFMIEAIVYPMFPTVGFRISNIMNLGFLIGVIALVRSAVKRRQYFAFFVLVAMMGPAAIIILAAIAKVRGIYIPLRQSLTIGLMWEAMVMTIGLSQRVHALRKKLVDSLSGQNDTLEIEVANRMKDLTDKGKIIASQQLEISAAAHTKSIAEMAVGFSHEINGPLTSLQDQITMVKRNVEMNAAAYAENVMNLDQAFESSNKIAETVRKLRLLTQEKVPSDSTSPPR